jgi:hypothetical protein
MSDVGSVGAGLGELADGLVDVVDVALGEDEDEEVDDDLV